MTRLYLTLVLIGVTAIWGLTFVMVRDAVSAYSVFAFLTMRFGLAALALLPFTFRALRWRTLLAGLPIGAALGLGMLLQTEGLRTTTATNSGFITGLYVVFAPLMAWLFFRAHVPPRVWLAVGLSLTGLLLIAGAHPGNLHTGDFLTLGAAFMFGLQIALLSRFSAGSDSAALALAQIAVSLLLVAPVALASGARIASPSVSVWFAIIITGLGASALGFWAQTYAQQRIPAGQAAVIMATEPVFAAIGGYFLAADRLSPVQWLGAALMLLALFVAEVWPVVASNEFRVTSNESPAMSEEL